MTAILITAGIIAALVILRRSAVVVILSYRVGVIMGRMIAASPAGKDSAPVPAVAAAWLMPWRAARRIRAQQEEIRLLIRTLATALERQSAVSGT